ncbi:MAG: hypothetical protein ACK48M_10580 [Planctomycetia bacterium]
MIQRIQRFGRGVCTRRRPGRLPRPLPSLAIVGLVAAVAVIIAQSPTEAQPASRSAARRFFDSLSKPRPAPPQEFIPAPTPPPVAPESANQPAVRIGAVPPATSPSKAKPQLPSTWPETVAFAASVRASANKIAADSLNPRYKPTAKATAKPTAKADTKAATTLASAKTADVPTASKTASSKQGTAAPPPKTKRLERLRAQVAQTLATYQRRPLNTAQHTPWEVMHGFIAFGIPTQLRVGGPGGDLVNAIGWINWGGRCRGLVLLARTGDRLVAMRGIGVQGHSAQYLAILAQCRVAINSPITLQSKAFTVADLVAEEKLSCKSNTELTFALIGLAHYLPTDAEWEARDGKTWTLEKLVAEELEQPIRGAPCGGTHRLFGLAYGCQRRLKATGRLDGHYARADKFVRDYQKFTLTKLQNRDGSFSTEWFKYPADRDDDIDRKVQTTGHILEWLVGSLDQESLYDPRIVSATEFLARALAREPSREWKIGPMGHALHALTIYQERVWGTVLPGGIAAYHGPMKASPEQAMVARKPDPTSTGEDDKPKRR